RPPPQSTLFPYTTLFRSSKRTPKNVRKMSENVRFGRFVSTSRPPNHRPGRDLNRGQRQPPARSSDRPNCARGTFCRITYVSASQDRKSTRLNSSHVAISY